MGQRVVLGGPVGDVLEVADDVSGGARRAVQDQRAGQQRDKDMSLGVHQPGLGVVPVGVTGEHVAAGGAGLGDFGGVQDVVEFAGEQLLLAVAEQLAQRRVDVGKGFGGDEKSQVQAPGRSQSGCWVVGSVAGVVGGRRADRRPDQRAEFRWGHGDAVIVSGVGDHLGQDVGSVRPVKVATQPGITTAHAKCFNCLATCTCHHAPSSHRWVNLFTAIRVTLLS